MSTTESKIADIFDPAFDEGDQCLFVTRVAKMIAENAMRRNLTAEQAAAFAGEICREAVWRIQIGDERYPVPKKPVKARQAAAAAAEARRRAMES